MNFFDEIKYTLKYPHISRLLFKYGKKKEK